MSALASQDPEVQSILRRAYVDFRYFCKVFYPEEFRSEFSPLHDQIIDKMLSPSQYTVFAAPRGLGKTTLMRVRGCHAILFRDVHFIVYLSNTAGSAENSTEHMKRLLRAPMIKTIFGDIKTNTMGVSNDFSKKSWVAFDDVFVLPRGWGQQVRGLNWMGHRPGLILVDDLETTEHVQQDDQRGKLKVWFFSDLTKTEARLGSVRPTQIVYGDTLKHEDSLLNDLLNASDWDSVSLAACNENFETNDAQYMTTAEIRAEYESHKEKGIVDVFYMEYMNIPLSLKDALFQPKHFRYFDETPDAIIVDGHYVLKKYLITMIIVDPARTKNMTAAESAVVTISVWRDRGWFFIRRAWAGRVAPDTLYDQIFSDLLLFQAKLLCVEITGLVEFIKQPLIKESEKRGIIPFFIWLDTSVDKDLRINGLGPFYRRGSIFHNKIDCQPLEKQLLYHPKSKRKDLADATAYLNLVFSEFPFYFEPDEGYGDDGMPPDNDDYDDLENDAPIEAHWRVI